MSSSVNWNANHKHINSPWKQFFSLSPFIRFGFVWIMEWSDRTRKNDVKTLHWHRQRRRVEFHWIEFPFECISCYRQKWDMKRSVGDTNNNVFATSSSPSFRRWCSGSGKKNSIMQLWLYPPFPCIRFNKFSFHNSFPHYGGVVWKSTNLDVVRFVNDCARYLFYGSRAPQWKRTYLLFQFVYLVVVFHFSNRCK